MKREFKKGDRVLIRDSDLQKWVPAEFEELDGLHFIATIDNGHQHVFYQCRHIDEFRTGDKVQVRDRDDQEWMDCTYACYIDNVIGRTNVHYVFVPSIGGVGNYKQCRWHPSLPWVEKEPLTLEQRVEALERKINEL